MGCEPQPVGELAEAFAGFADQLLDRLRRLEERVLALEVVIATMVRDEVTGPELRRTVMQRLGTEIRQSIIANSSSLEAAAALVGAMLELLPEPKPERKGEQPEPPVEARTAAEAAVPLTRLDSAAPCRLQ